MSFPQEIVDENKEAKTEYVRSEYSDELDRLVMISQYWRDILRDHGREIAESKVMYEQSTIECLRIHREQEKAYKERRLIPAAEWEKHLEDRKILCERGCSLEDRKAFDNAFIANQEAQGRSASEWKNSHGDCVQKEIDSIQATEKFWTEHCQWTAEKNRREEQAEQELERKRYESDQRFAGMFAAAVTVEAEKMLQKMIKDIISSGVLHGK